MTAAEDGDADALTDIREAYKFAEYDEEPATLTETEKDSPTARPSTPCRRPLRRDA